MSRIAAKSAKRIVTCAETCRLKLSHHNGQQNFPDNRESARSGSTNVKDIFTIFYHMGILPNS